MALDAARFVIVARVHRRFNELVFFVAPMALRKIARQREESGGERRPFRPSMFHLRAGWRMTGAAEFGGAVLAAMTDRAAVFEQRMRRRRTDIQVEFRMRAPRVQDVIGTVLNSFQLRDSLFRFLALILRNLVCVEDRKSVV